MFTSGTNNSKKAEVMLTVFFDYCDVVHYEFLPGQTVNKEYYLSVMQHLREAIRKKRVFAPR